ncbi:hypothetical protein D9M68_958840 [compost metagenome]
MVHRVIDECRVHDDVAVVGEKQVGATGLELLDPGIGHPVGGAIDGAIDVSLDFIL